MYEVFEQLLQKFNTTAYRVGKETNIAASTFSDWKNGRSTPKNDKLKRIADYFGVSVSYLMGEEKSITPTIEFKNDEDALEFINALSYLDKMNTDGLKAANRYLAYLTKFNEYMDNHDSQILTAAHDRTDVEITKEGLEHDNAIMDNDEFWNK